MAHPEGHLAGGGHVRVWFPAEEVDEGCGGVEGEGGGQQSVHQGRRLAQRGHRVSLAQVQGPQLQPVPGYLHISTYIYTYLHISTHIYTHFYSYTLQLTGAVTLTAHHYNTSIHYWLHYVHIVHLLL